MYNATQSYMDLMKTSIQRKYSLLWFVVTVLIYSIKQSGTSYKSEKHRIKVRYIHYRRTDHCG